jgi:hypothetical protein
MSVHPDNIARHMMIAMNLIIANPTKVLSSFDQALLDARAGTQERATMQPIPCRMKIFPAWDWSQQSPGVSGAEA